MNVPEKEIQASILEYLRLKKVVCWKTGSGAFRMGDRFVRMGQAGLADIIDCLPSGRFLAVEVKQPRKHPTPLQKRFLAEIENNGGLALARAIDDVIERLR